MTGRMSVIPLLRPIRRRELEESAIKLGRAIPERSR